MRISGNRLLKTLPGKETRPTTALVREAIFNIWQGKVDHCAWLDLCAGNGSMGAEALCRGAQKVVGIENSDLACRLIRENWQKLARSEQQFQVLRGDVRTRLKTIKKQQFDLIYFDPPYHSDLYLPVLTILAQSKILVESGEIAVEHPAKHWSCGDISGLNLIRNRAYGNTEVSFYSILE